MLAQVFEPVVVLDQAVDLADAVARVLDRQFAAGHAGLDLDPQRARRASAVRVFPQPLPQGAHLRRRHQVPHEQKAGSVVLVEFRFGERARHGACLAVQGFPAG